jgi:cytochrome c-type biogenesis protein
MKTELKIFALFSAAFAAVYFMPVGLPRFDNAVFFGSLLPLAVKQQSTWLLPAVYGVGSALPVLVFGILLTVARQSAGRAFGHLQKLDRWLLPVTGWLLVAVGLYLIIARWLS